jgi:hypothetical protein
MNVEPRNRAGLGVLRGIEFVPRRGNNEPAPALRTRRAHSIVAAALLIVGIAGITAMSSQYCSPADKGLVCKSWAIVYPAIFAIGLFFYGNSYVSRYRRKLESARVEPNDEMLWILFDKPGVEARVTVFVSRDGALDVYAKGRTFDSMTGSMTILYFGQAAGFTGSPHKVELPELYRAIPWGDAADPIESARDDGVVIGPGRRRLVSLNDRYPTILPSSAARIPVLRHGVSVDESSIASGLVRSPCSSASTESEEAAMLPRVLATSSMAVRSEDGLQHLPVSCFETRGSDSSDPGYDYYVGQYIELDLLLRSDDLRNADIPNGYQLVRSNPQPVSAFELHWSSADSCQPSYVLANQGIRDSASHDSLVAGVFLGAAAGFVAPLVDRLMAFLSP